LRRPKAHGTICGGFWPFAAENPAGNVFSNKIIKKYICGGFVRICGGFKPPEKKWEIKI
jgi:hypothetical protein